jgi:hypothetical protein
MNGKQAKRLRKEIGLKRQVVQYRFDRDGSKHCVGPRAAYLTAKTKFKRGEV